MMIWIYLLDIKDILNKSLQLKNVVTALKYKPFLFKKNICIKQHKI